MGRYYSGDIEGKFWFGVQSSDAASRFGVMPSEPQVIQYHFEIDHLPLVEDELNYIKEKLGDKIEKIDKFFSEKNGYTDESLNEAGIKNEWLVDYADYKLGLQIRDCLIENGDCYFECEC